MSGAVEPVGAVVHALAVADALQALGHDAEVWVPAAAHAALGGAERAPVRPVAIPDAAADPEERARTAVAALTGALAAGEPADVEHAQDSVAGAALLLLRAEGRAGAVVRTVHHVDASSLPGLDELQRASIQDTDACICPSAFWADRLLAEFGVEATVVPGGVDAARLATPLTRAEAGARFGWAGRPAVLALGGISRRKGSRVLLEAFARSRARLGDDGLLVIAGRDAGEDDYVEAFRADAARLGLGISGPRPGAGDSVALLGAVPSGDMPALHRAVDALAYPSTREGFGLAVLEAASAGLPAVVSDLPVLRESLADGRDCLMVPAGDSGPLADALVRLVRDRRLRARLAAGGRETAARFRWADAAEAHLRVYEGVLAAR